MIYLRSKPTQRCEAYTFLEIALALGIIAVVFAATLPVISASHQERQLKNGMEHISYFVGQTRWEAERSGKEHTIFIQKGGLAVQEKEDYVVKVALPKQMKLFYRFPGEEWVEANDQPWRIFSSGLVFPLSLRLTDRSTWIEADFDFLTGSVSEERYSF